MYDRKCAVVCGAVPQSNSSQWWAIFIKLPCSHPVCSPGLDWEVSFSIAGLALVEIFQGLAGPQGNFGV